MSVWKRSLPIISLMAMALLALWIEPALADKLADAIAKAPQGTGPGQITPGGTPGFLGIPGAPVVNPFLAFGWAVWVGWIFSTVGAFGGVMSGVGHMSVFGFGAYAGAFKQTAPELGRVVTDSIKASNQFMVGLSAAISSFNYLKMKRLVLPLAFTLGLGSLIGAWAAQELSAGKLDFRSYQGYFGLFVLLLGGWLFYETTPAGQSKKQTAKKAAKAFEEAAKKIKCGQTVDASCYGLHITQFTLSRCAFTFYGVPFSFNPVVPFIGGVLISAVAAFLGVGGGFLLVPFLTSVTQLPMYLAAGTSALAVLVSMVTSIITLLLKGTPIEWHFIGLEMLGHRRGLDHRPDDLQVFLRRVAQAPVYRAGPLRRRGLPAGRLCRLQAARRVKGHGSPVPPARGAVPAP